MFGKPKAKIAKPETPEEAAAVIKGVGKMYPQMSDPNWGKPKKKSPKRETAVGRIKRAADEADAPLREALTPEEIKRLGGY